MTLDIRKFSLMFTFFVAMTTTLAVAGESRLHPIEARLDSIDVLSIMYGPSNPEATVTTRRSHDRGGCPPETYALTDSDFGPGQYVLQAGFEQGESAAISFTLPP